MGLQRDLFNGLTFLVTNSGLAMVLISFYGGFLLFLVSLPVSLLVPVLRLHTQADGVDATTRLWDQWGQSCGCTWHVHAKGLFGLKMKHSCCANKSYKYCTFLRLRLKMYCMDQGPGPTSDPYPDPYP